MRLFARLPRWVLWLSGIGIALAYVFLILPIVLHYTPSWKAHYGEVPEPEGYPVRGIDISHYQNRIDWDQLRKARLGDFPISFVIAKSTEGATIADQTFSRNFLRARQKAFVRGAYHFFIPGTDAAKQARFFISKTKLAPGDLPPILDIEKTGNLSKKELQESVLAWLNIVEKAYGTPPIIYTYYSFKKSFLNTPAFDRYPFWIAHYYKDKLSYDGPWVMWQYTDCGHVDGIKENVDCNVFNGSLKDLLNMTLK